MQPCCHFSWSESSISGLSVVRKPEGNCYELRSSESSCPVRKNQHVEARRVWARVLLKSRAWSLQYFTLTPWHLHSAVRGFSCRHLTLCTLLSLCIRSQAVLSKNLLEGWANVAWIFSRLEKVGLEKAVSQSHPRSQGFPEEETNIWLTCTHASQQGVLLPQRSAFHLHFLWSHWPPLMWILHLISLGSHRKVLPR